MLLRSNQRRSVGPRRPAWKIKFSKVLPPARVWSQFFAKFFNVNSVFLVVNPSQAEKYAAWGGPPLRPHLLLCHWVELFVKRVRSGLADPSESLSVCLDREV